VIEVEKKGLEVLLKEAGLINDTQISTALEEQEKKNKPLEDVLVDLGYLPEEKVVEYLSKELGVPYRSLDGISIDPDLITEVPEDVARKHVILPIEKKEGEITLAMRDPFNFFIIDEVQSLTGCKIKPVLCSRAAILKKLNEYRDHYKVLSIEKLLKEVESKPEAVSIGKEGIESLDQVAQQAPIIKIVNLMILQAMQRRASDIHIQPEEKEVLVRYRIDGILQEAKILPKNLAPAIISRVKIMSEMDIAERRLPQDGHFSLRMEKKEIDFRVSTIPTINGEKVVIRILDRGSLLLGLDYLGFNPENLSHFRSLIRKPHGIIIIVGPTGSGKTTTLYSALHSINLPDKNITTVENPVEYRLGNIAQIQIKPKIGLTFAAVLRAILRQDPDIILVGEIRDLETTEIAIRASLTGHLVFATLHTNEAAGAITRLIDMGAEPFLIASSVKGVMGQRLVRTICSSCKESYQVETEHLKRLGLSSEEKLITLYRGRGCKACFHTGYQGRMAISELMLINEEIRRLIVAKAPSPVIKEAAVKAGMKTIREDGLEKVLAGNTTLEEVLRVTEEEE